MRSLQDELREYIAAAFPGIWVQSHEHDEAIREIAALCKEQKWSLAAWDIDKGLQCGTPRLAAPDPLTAVRALANMAKPDSSDCWCCPTTTSSWAAPRSSSAWPTPCRRARPAARSS